MKPFVHRLLAFVLLQMAVGAALWHLCPRSSDHYAAATIDKHARLRSAPDPRIILVGGSSMAFGIDSSRFESLGLNPVNMAIHVGLGLRFMVAEIRDELREGDVVLVSPEYPLFWQDFKRDSSLEFIERRPASVRFIHPRQLRRLADQGLVYISGKVRCAAHQLSTDRALPAFYTRQAFNELGDFVAHRGSPRRVSREIVHDYARTGHPDVSGGIQALGELAAACRQRGARCYLAFPPVRMATHSVSAAVIDDIARRVRDEVDLHVLLTPDEAVHSPEEFFDDGQHLCEDALLRRTDQLVERLRQAR